jgi:tripartite-type tricarboxylate transporter receptor subunit TctC
MLPFAKQGRVRMIGLSTAERSPAAPDVATFRESGIPELKNFVVENYYGFMAPAATPKEVQARIEADLKRVLSNQDLVTRMNNAGLDLFQRSPQEMRELYRSDIEKFARAAAVAAIKPE